MNLIKQLFIIYNEKKAKRLIKKDTQHFLQMLNYHEERSTVVSASQDTIIESMITYKG